MSSLTVQYHETAIHREDEANQDMDHSFIRIIRLSQLKSTLMGLPTQSHTPPIQTIRVLVQIIDSADEIWITRPTCKDEMDRECKGFLHASPTTQRKTKPSRAAYTTVTGRSLVPISTTPTQIGGGCSGSGIGIGIFC